MVNENFDVVVIGAGMGGLLSAALLAKEGYKVAVLEKNKQIGGSLQSFGVDKKLFESAVHYIGSLNNGETLYKIFKYMGILDTLALKRLDTDCFDKIIIGSRSYRMAQGHQNFVNTLAAEFPHQREELERYIGEIKTVCRHFPLYNLRLGSLDEKKQVAGFGLKQKLDEIFSDEILKQVLTANNMLYGGDYVSTPFYIHALIENSYIESSWKCEQGSIQIALHLQKMIQNAGGKVFRNREVKHIIEQNGKINYVETMNGERYFAKNFISNLHPSITYKLLDSKLVRNITKKRIEAIPNTMSAFMLNISLKERHLEYQNYNTYYHQKPDVWHDLSIGADKLPNSYAIFFYQDQQNPQYARGISILCYMHIGRFGKWQQTYRTTNYQVSRGSEYQDEKSNLAEKCILAIESILPGLSGAVQKIDVCSPLTYRDYLNIPQGAMYGMKKEVHNLDNTNFATRTKVPNLFLTGQNINLHGILGVSITALLTVGELTGLEYIVEKINNSQS